MGERGEERWLTVSEAAKEFGLVPQTVHRWAKAGIVPLRRRRDQTKEVDVGALEADFIERRQRYSEGWQGRTRKEISRAQVERLEREVRDLRHENELLKRTIDRLTR
jgi:predicted transcriptional regulator